MENMKGNNKMPHDQKGGLPCAPKTRWRYVIRYKTVIKMEFLN